MSDPGAFKLLYSEVFKNGGDVAKVQSKMHQQIKCYVKESYPYFLVADNYFYVPCYFTKKAVEQFKAKTPNVKITELKGEVVLIQDWGLELAQVNSANVFTSYAGVELRLVVKSFKVQGNQGAKLSISRYPVNIYRDSEMKNLISSFVSGAQSAAIAAGVKSESLPDISKMQAKASVSQGVVKFAAGETFSAYGFKSANTATVDMGALYKSEGGVAKAKAADKSVKPKVKGGSKAIKKSPKKAAGGVAGKLAKFTPGGKKTLPKKSVGAAGAGTMASPGDGMSAAATAEAKTMKQFKQMLAYLKQNKCKGKASASKKGKASRK